ncbi:MAG TPA: hypothetical protein PLM07_08135 [Candidatus Rifleibacterium sp.]|nr:hypothetical protein [Candidatus Rifleibacterium sp.]HPT45853.1 hypothetical protein [Candidatus Rifleibacterium sp.]
MIVLWLPLILTLTLFLVWPQVSLPRLFQRLQCVPHASAGEMPGILAFIKAKTIGALTN